MARAKLKRPPPLQLNDWLGQQSRIDLLRFITCGSVDDGKSTLIGRLLWESGQVFDDQMAAVRADSKRHGTQGDAPDLALLVDGLAAEREQGITIEVAYRFFTTLRRKFIVADTPGHEQYTRNMVTGASTVDAAVLLVDATQGLLTQTRRHAHLVALMGIRHVVLAVNKMDRIGFDRQRFQNIDTEFQQLATQLGFKLATAIPVSALQGDNVLTRSGHTGWYNGPTLMGWLETVNVKALKATGVMAFPVQWVNRPHSDFRGFSGTLSAGEVRVGDEVRVTASGQVAKVARILTQDGDQPEAHAGDALTLTLDREVDASRGDVLSLARQPLATTDQFEATVVWMHDEPCLVGRTYDLKLAHQWAGATLTSIKHRIDVNTSGHEPARQLGMNDIAVCNLALSRTVTLAPFDESHTLGGFILVDRYTQSTVAAGMVRHNLRRADNVHRQSLSMGRAERERLNGHRGQVIWFTGLSGSGKSTLANALEQHLHAQGLRTYILDGDNLRQGLNKDLGFTPADRVENIRRVAEVARLMMDAGLVVMTAFISPFRQERDMARALIGEENFAEVHVNTPLAECEKRDPKGLYKKARQGDIPNMTGISSPYEAPLQPDCVIDTVGATLPEAVIRLAGLLHQGQSAP